MFDNKSMNLDFYFRNRNTPYNERISLSQTKRKMSSMEENVEQPDRFRKVKDLVQNVKTNETVKQIKLHLIENKKTYIVGAIGVIAYASKSRPVQIVNNNNVKPLIAPVFNNTVNNGGYMHKIVQDLETGEIWEQISHLACQIAEDHGITVESARTALSRHLNGKAGHVYGKNYRILGIGSMG
jgi:hypothetical protein